MFINPGITIGLGVTFMPPVLTTPTVEYLVVAGGGGGGWVGGGGAGGYSTDTGLAVSSGSAITVTVGAGGGITAGTSTSSGVNGDNSVFGTITSVGGGGGGSYNGLGASTGGSGGGSFSGAGGAAYAGYGSNYFDGTGDYLTVPANAAFAMGTGDFTIECWINTSLVDAQDDVIIELRSSGATSTGFVFNLNPTGIGYQLNFYTDGAFNLGSTVLNYNVWNHCAVTRSGTTVRLFSNGALSATFTKANNFSDTPVVYIGNSPLYSPSDTIGYISNLRVVKGTAVYTTTFTPPTAPLAATQSSGTNISAITGTQTSLLTCQSNSFVDASTNQFAITVYGNTAWNSTTPFVPYSAYWVSQGNAGGAGSGNNSGGGGGGASANGQSAPTANQGGNGGAGTSSSISGSATTYAGGGGGYTGSGSTTTGGAGGGGNGGNYNVIGPTVGTVNTGGGGGGGGYTGNPNQAGGSGIVIIRYSDAYQAATSTTGSPTITVSGGYRIYMWTSSGSITF